MKFRVVLTTIIVVLLLTTSSSASAYDAETHALITYQAFVKSGLSTSGAGSTLSRLGLDRLDAPTPFNVYWINPPTDPTYFDNVAVSSPTQYPSLTVWPRTPDEVERCQMQKLLDVQEISMNDPMVFNQTTVAFFPIQNWLLRGTTREDDLSYIGNLFGADPCGVPASDPYGDIMRVMNHFYDPINNIALTTGCSLFGYNGLCAKSVDWALGDVDSFASPPVVDTNRRNHFTYADARENMWLALVGERGRLSPPYVAFNREEDSIERLERWASMFRDLGDVVHLLEDGAQPQHVRNDAHSPLITSQERQAFESYTEGRVLKETVSGEDVNNYVRGFFEPGNDPTLPPIVTGDYPEVMFATPIRFFTTRKQTDGPTVLPDGRYGLMDYTNRGFFTGGTLPDPNSSNDFLEPPQTLNAANGYASSSTSCAISSYHLTAMAVACTHLTHAVKDSVDAGYADVLPTGFTAPPLVTVGAFQSAVPLFGITPPNLGDAMGLEEFQTQANLAIPRAIAYSAGLIDYFFRGQIAITQPPAGLYAILDDGQPHTVDADGYPRDANNNIFGFTTVQLNFLNATPPITESGSGITVNQRMTNGQLVAVARYHRNKCYQPDLSGELGENFDTGALYDPPSCNVYASRSAYQEISVSASLAVDANGMVTIGGQPYDVNGTTPILATFDFSADPIPANATDLFIQVVYRGNMGDTVSGAPMIEPDAIAVGTVDVSEPTSIFTLDGTDYFLVGSQWDTPTQAQSVVPAGTDVNPVPFGTVQVCIDDRVVLAKGDGANQATFVPATGAVRLEGIFDTTTGHYPVFILNFWENTLQPQIVARDSYPLPVRKAQADYENDPGQGTGVGAGAYAPDRIGNMRSVGMGTFSTNFFKSYQGSNTATYFPQDPLPVGPNGYLPLPADAVYLNNQNVALCSLPSTYLPANNSVRQNAHEAAVSN